MMIVVLLGILILVYLTVNLVALAIRNRRAHKFFATKSPQLPVLPNPDPFSGHSLRVLHSGKNWKIIENLHEQYGPTFGYYMCDQPWVSTKDLDLIKLVEIDAAHKHINRASYMSPFKEFNHSLLQLEGDNWRRVRRVFGPALSNHVIRRDRTTSEIEKVVNRVSRALKRRMERSKTDSSSFELDAMYLSQQYVTGVIFSVQYRQPEAVDFDSDKDTWTYQMDSAAREVTHPVLIANMVFPFLRPICKVLLKFHSTGWMIKKICNFIETATDTSRLRREKLETVKNKRSRKQANNLNDPAASYKLNRDSTDIIIDGFLDGNLTHLDFVSNICFLATAAYVTSSHTIVCLLWQLAKNPDIQEKLRMTIQETKEGIDSDYVSWCVHETIRFFPGIPLGTGRVLGEDVTVNGLFLAKGTFVMPTTHGIHHDPKVWPEPGRFLPERWRDRANFHPAAFLGFGLGPRNCVGSKMALHEIKLLMRMILSEYRIETCDKTPDEWRFSSPGLFWTINDDPIMLRFVSLSQQT